MTQSEPLGKAAGAAGRLHRYLFGILLVVLLSALESWSFAAEPLGYYATAAGKTGPTLREALHQIIAGHTVVPYSSSTKTDTVDALKGLDEDPFETNNVFVLYAQKSEPKNSYGQTNGWQHEHRWPNSYGIDSIGPAYSDLYNLHAEDANVNASRGNKYYDNSDPTDRNYHNPAHVEAPLCTSDTDSWEPPASIKGDLARSIFYMAIRYTGDRSNEPALHLTDNSALIKSTNSYMGKLSTLLAWHHTDPVSADEQTRHENIYAFYQHNRNPFIDHPEWVDLAFAPVADSQTVITDENMPLLITLTGSDVEGSTLTYFLATTASHGVLSGSGNNLVYEPRRNYFGPDSFSFTVNNGSLDSAPATVAIMVNPVDSAPVLTVPPDQTITELSTLTVTNSASDADLPANTLTFSLVSAPAGMNLDSSTGVLTWTPTEAQGPSTNLITVRVTDNGEPQSSDTKSFTVVVNEANSAPTMTVIADETVYPNSLVTLTAAVTDPDIPANSLTFGLDPGAPSGASIDPANGLFRWTASDATPGTNVFTIRVTDDGSPPMSDSKSFTIVVAAPPVIQSIAASRDNVTITWTAIAGKVYQVEYKSDLAASTWNVLSGDVTASTDSAAKADVTASTARRFYRIVAVP